jgi:hypothetical protein
MIGTAVEAEYTPSPIPSFQGNLFIEALPSIPDAETLLGHLRKKPNVDSGLMKLPPEQRAHLIMDQLQDEFFEPFRENFDLFYKLDRLIRRGYKHRNPLHPANATRFEVDGNGAAKRFQFGGMGPVSLPAGLGMAIIGISGIGKTMALVRALSFYPQVIMHGEYQGVKIPLTQVTWVRLEAPPGGSLKALALNFLHEVDRLAGTSYSEHYRRANLDYLLTSVANVAFQQGVGAIVIDEVQALIKGKSPVGRTAVMDFLTSLTNVIGVPVILIGTPASLPVLTQEFRQARRSSSLGDFRWHRHRNDEAFDHFCRELWNHQFLLEPVEYTSSVRKELYACSQGITDLVIKVFQEAQVRAAANGSETLSPDLLRRVMEEEFPLIHSVIEAIRCGEWKSLLQLSDVNLPEIISSSHDSSSSAEDGTAPEGVVDYLLEEAIDRQFGGG